MSIQKVKIVAYLLGKNIHLKNFKEAYQGGVYSSTFTEVFLKKGETSFIYVQNYGEVSFSNCSEETIHEFIASVMPYVDAPLPTGKEYKEDFSIEVDSGQPLKFDYNFIQVPEINADVIKIAMLNVSQSVVLDYFMELSQNHLSETDTFSRELEQRG